MTDRRPPRQVTVVPCHTVHIADTADDRETLASLASERYAENLPSRYEFDEFLPIRPVDILA